jgi:hypothetical protein
MKRGQETNSIPLYLMILRDFVALPALFILIIFSALFLADWRNPPPLVSTHHYDISKMPNPNPLPPGFKNLTDDNFKELLTSSKVGDKFRQDFTAVDLELCATEKGYAAKKKVFSNPHEDERFSDMTDVMKKGDCSQLLWGEYLRVTKVTPMTVTLVETTAGGDDDSDATYVFHKAYEPFLWTPAPDFN